MSLARFTCSYVISFITRIFGRTVVSLVGGKKPALTGAASILLCMAWLLACGPSKQSKNADSKRYRFTGRVVSLDKQNRSMVVDGDEIPGFMSAMTMSYKVINGSDLNQVAVGDTVSADIVARHDDYWLENIKVVQHTSSPPNKPSATLHIPESGDPVPNFALVNQSGKRISLRQYRGEALILTFIYTRCPFPNFCPRVSGQFAEVEHKLASEGALYGKTHLLTISFDPAHDTPKVLRDYRALYLKNPPPRFDHWEFAVASVTELPKIAAYFALTYTDENRSLTHSASTAVIGPDGRIFRWYHGADWTSSDLLKDASDALRAAG
jgi:protein SCO1